jgi:diacylglycerol kinase (ATP)
MRKERPKGLPRLWRAWKNSLAGLHHAWSHEPSFRMEAVLLVVLAPLALWLGETSCEKALLVGSLLLVLFAELINSAVEAVVDRIGPDIHPLSGRAKDMGSAAVLFAMLHAVVVWLLILVL